MGRASELLQRLRRMAVEAKEMGNGSHADPDWRMPLRELETLCKEITEEFEEKEVKDVSKDSFEDSFDSFGELSASASCSVSLSEKRQLCRDLLALRLRPSERLTTLLAQPPWSKALLAELSCLRRPSVKALSWLASQVEPSEALLLIKHVAPQALRPLKKLIELLIIINNYY